MLCAMLAIISSASFLSVGAQAATTASKKEVIAKKEAYAPAQKQVMEYDVYAGGFHVVSADLTVDAHKKSNYFLRLAAYTHGILAKLAPWHGVFETTGRYDSKKENPHPDIHLSDTTWRDEKERVEFVYNKDGSFKEHRIFNEKEKGKQPPKPELSKGTTDVLTSTLKIMASLAKDGSCDGSDKIFDGARSYNLVFKQQAQDVLKPSGYNVYAGPAVRCTVEVKPIAGKWHEKPRGWMSIQEQGRERGTMPTVWFARMAEGEPAVPVKIQVKTQYGALMMHLTSYKGAGKAIKISQQ